MHMLSILLSLYIYQFHRNTGIEMCQGLRLRFIIPGGLPSHNPCTKLTKALSMLMQLQDIQQVNYSGLVDKIPCHLHHSNQMGYHYQLMKANF